MKPLPIILDTDIGDDIDDALALAVILNSPELELRGVTTVFRDAHRRALLTEYLLDVWDRGDVPIAVGASKPLLQPFDPRLGNQFEILDRFDEMEASLEQATDFLWRTLDKAKEKITIVPIGPLTNIALLLARDPALALRCRIVLMGGMWNHEDHDFRAEWNIVCDPEAAAIVFNSGADIAMIGLDVTLRCVMSQQQVKEFAAHDSPRVQVLSKLIELWMRQTQVPPTLHDPLAVLSLFSDCVRFEERRVEVQLCGEERGATRVVEGAPNARVAVDVDVERALQLFMERVLL